MLNTSYKLVNGVRVYMTNVVSIGYMGTDSARALRHIEGQAKVAVEPTVKLSASGIRGKRVY